MKKSISTIFCTMLFCGIIHAQIETKADNSTPKLKHRFSIFTANAHVPSSTDVPGASKNTIIPVLGLDYDYRINKKWALGIHADYVLQKYKIDHKENNTTLERSHPLSISLVGSYKVIEHWSVFSGFGREFEKTENLNFLELGLEYGIELPKNWEVALNLKYENKFRTYDSWLFGIGFSKSIR